MTTPHSIGTDKYRDLDEIVNEIREEIKQAASSREGTTVTRVFLFEPNDGAPSPGIHSALDDTTLRMGGWVPVKVKLELKTVSDGVEFRIVVLNPRQDPLSGWELFYDEDPQKMLYSEIDSKSTVLELRDLNLYYMVTAYPAEQDLTNKYPVIKFSVTLDDYLGSDVVIDVDGTKLQAYGDEGLPPYRGEDFSSYARELLEKVVDALNSDISVSHAPHFSLSDFDIDFSSITLPRISYNKYFGALAIEGFFRWYAWNDCSGSGSGTESYEIDNEPLSDNIHMKYGGYTLDYLSKKASINLNNLINEDLGISEVRIVKDSNGVNETNFAFTPYPGGKDELLNGFDVRGTDIHRFYLLNETTAENTWSYNSTVEFTTTPLTDSNLSSDMKGLGLAFTLANFYGSGGGTADSNLVDVWQRARSEDVPSEFISYVRSWSDHKYTTWTVNKTVGNETIIEHKRCDVMATIGIKGVRLLDTKTMVQEVVYKQVKIPHITITAGLVDITEYHVDAEVMGDTKVVPALAPIGYFGLYTKLSNYANMLAPDLNLAENLKELTENMPSFMGIFYPSYIPIPAPEELSLNTFVKGEYFGCYVFTPGIRISSLDNALLLVPGLPVATFFFEEVTAYYDGGTAIASYEDGRLRVINGRNEIKTYTLGLGVGNLIGTEIGNRTYFIPSDGYGFTNPEGEEQTNGLLGILKDISNSDAYKTIIKFTGGDDSPFKKLMDSLQMFADYGAYIQVTPYATRNGKVPLMVFLTTETPERFIAVKDGHINVDISTTIMHFKVVTVPVIGLPIIIPIVITKEAHGTANVNVDNIDIMSLFIMYDPINGFDEAPVARDNLEDVIKYISSGSGIGIYAVPVWSKTGYPVLLRGNYADSSLVLIASYGDNHAYTDVTDIGMPMFPIRILYKDLYKVDTIELRAAWKIGNQLYIGDVTEKALKVEVSRPRAHIIHVGPNSAIIYVGKYVGEPVSESAEEFLSEAKGNLENFKGFVSDWSTQVLYDVADKIEPDMSADELIHDVTTKLGVAIKNLIENIAAGMIAEFAKVVTIALIPDPTGGFFHALLYELVSYIADYVKSEVLQPVNIKEVIEGILFDVVEWVVRKSMATIIREYVAPAIGDFMGEVASNIEKELGIDASKMLDSSLQLVTISKNLLVTRPSLINKAWLVKVGTTDVSTAVGILGETVLPVDIVQTGDRGEEGVFLLIRPASAISSSINALLGIFNVDYRVPDVTIDVGSILGYAKGWVSWISSVIGSDLSSIEDALDSGRETYENILTTLDSYVYLDGFNATRVTMPSVIYLPPSNIE